MRVHVQAFATLRAFLPPGSPEDSPLDVPDGSTIRDVTRALGIADAMALVALLNGREADPDQAVASGDVIVLFPPLAGGRPEALGASDTLGAPLEASRNPVGLPDFKSGVRL